MTHLNLDLQPEAIRQFVLALSRAPDGVVLESAGHAVACLVCPSPSASLRNGQWSRESNQRRGELLDRNYDVGLSPAEEAELALLQDAFERHVDKVAPLSIGVARALHQELLEKAAQQHGLDTP